MSHDGTNVGESEYSHRLDGHLFPWTCPKNTIDELRDYDVFEDDVWIATYPKAGTHWAIEILGNIFAGGEAKMDSKFRRPPVEMTLAGDGPASLEGTERNHHKIAKWSSPRLINTHLPFNMLPKKIGTVKPKIVYFARNPKDTCVSMYTFLNRMRSLYTCDATYDTLDDYIKAFCDGSVLMGDWWRHTVGYWDMRQRDNIMFVTFEEVKKNPTDTIKRIANFLERPLSKKGLENAVYNTLFETMKNSEAYCKKPALLRKGEVADWKKHFTDSQNKYFDQIYEEKMKNTDLTFQFE